MSKKIFWLDDKEFSEKLNMFPYAEKSKENINNAYLNFINFMIRKKYILNSEVLVMDEENIDDAVREFIREKDSFGLKSIYRTCLKPIFSLHNLTFDRSKYNISNFVEFKDISDRFLTKEEFENELEMVYNRSDKLILYMAYFNILGTEFENVTYAEKTDIDFKNKKWILKDGKVIDFNKDRFLEELLKDVIKQDKYIPYTKPSSLGNIPESYPYNENSIYLFKTRKHPRTNDGMSPIYYEGIKRTYIRLSREFGKMFTRNNLKISRVLNVMYEINPVPKWTIKDIKNLKQELELKITETDIKIFYLQKYFPELFSKQ